MTVLALALATLMGVPPAEPDAASLRVDQRYADAGGRVSLLTRSGGRGYVTARTRCGRIADRRVRFSRGRFQHVNRRSSVRISGTVVDRDTARIAIRKGRCVARLTLRRVTEAQ